MRTRRGTTSPASLLLTALTCLLIPLLSTAAPAQADAATSGCTSRGGIETCFTSPPTVAADPTVLDRASTLFGAAGAGDTIRVAMFRWDIERPTDALIAAQRRGAVVHLVADDDLRLNRHGRRLIRTIEQQDPDRTNVTVCDGACLPWRAPGPHPDSQDVQHLKFYLTEIDGVQSFITSSANLEAVQFGQYNSLLKIDDPALYAFGLDYFARLEAQSVRAGGRSWDDRRKSWSGGTITAAVYPNRRDLLMSTLRNLSCTRGARDVSAMFAVIQRADVRSQLARLAGAGCRVRVITSRDTVENWLETPQRRGTLSRRSVRTVLTHDKMLVAHARFRGRTTHLTLTGTSNTTCGGLLYNDEVMLRIVDNRWLYGRYLGHFDDAYARARQSTSRVMPVMKPCRA